MARKTVRSARMLLTPLVDGLFCAVGILLVILLMQRYGKNDQGHIPQWDMRLTCFSPEEDIDNYFIVAQVGEAEEIDINKNMFEEWLKNTINDSDRLEFFIAIEYSPTTAFCSSEIMSIIKQTQQNSLHNKEKNAIMMPEFLYVTGSGD